MKKSTLRINPESEQSLCVKMKDSEVLVKLLLIFELFLKSLVSKQTKKSCLKTSRMCVFVFSST